MHFAWQYRAAAVHRAAKAIEDKPIDLAAAIDLGIVAQALKELG
jgi:hypothetical protein